MRLVFVSTIATILHNVFGSYIPRSSNYLAIIFSIMQGFIISHYASIL